MSVRSSSVPAWLADCLTGLLDEAPGDLAPLGHGTDHRAYVTSTGLVVRVASADDPSTRETLRREVELLERLTGVLTIDVPEPVAADLEAGVMVCRRLEGVPLLDAPRTDPERLAPALGRMLTELHGWGSDADTVLVRDAYPTAAWHEEAAQTYLACASALSPVMRGRVEGFLATSPPADSEVDVPCHNDLGAEHLLIDPATGELTGVIDWSDAALTDPARDLARPYRDLGPRALDAILSAYGGDVDDAAPERVTFYARCTLLEDLAYGLDVGDDRYVRAALTSFWHVFEGPS